MLSAEYERAGAAETSDSMRASAIGEVHCADHSSRCAVKSRQSAVPATRHESETSATVNAMCSSY